uniref:Uncharacterized protein n=1 Tax=Oryza rufipogon TaxID=4529 RepID=A0A0E0RGV5_ORYRU
MNYFTTAAKRLPSAGIIPEFHAAISDASQASHNAFSGSSYCVLQMVPFHYGEGVFQISYHGGSLTERRLRLISHHPLNARLTPRVVVPFRHRRALNERRGLPHRWSFPIHRGRPQVPIRRPEPTSSPTAAAGDKVFPMRRRRRSPPLPMRSFPSAAAAAVTAH